MWAEHDCSLTAMRAGVVCSAKFDLRDVPGVLEPHGLELTEGSRRKLDANSGQGPADHGVPVDGHHRPSASGYVDRGGVDANDHRRPLLLGLERVLAQEHLQPLGQPGQHLVDGGDGLKISAAQCVARHSLEQVVLGLTIAALRPWACWRSNYLAVDVQQAKNFLY
jgi:hypothetical protein